MGRANLLKTGKFHKGVSRNVFMTFCVEYCTSRTSRLLDWALPLEKMRYGHQWLSVFSSLMSSITQPWAYEAREFLRSHVVGKPVTFTVAHTLPSNDDTIREIGFAECQGADIATELVKAGWAKLKEIKRDPSEADLKRRELEAEARTAGKGVWNPHGPKVRL